MSVTVVEHASCLPDGASAVPDTPGWFDANQWLGRRGHRHLPLPAQLALAVTRRLPATAVPGDLHGLWLGSASAAQYCLDEIDGRILGDGAGTIGPMSAPFFSVNVIPARAAQELGTTGGATTITSAGTAALDAFACAARAIRLGHLDVATVVAVETGIDPLRVRPAPTTAPPTGEYGAAAVRLGRVGAVGVRWASGFVRSDPGAAARRVVGLLRAASTTPTVLVGPGAEDGDPLRAAGGLTAFVAITDAVAQRRPVTVVLTSTLGAATGVTLEPGVSDA